MRRLSAAPPTAPVEPALPIATVAPSGEELAALIRPALDQSGAHPRQTLVLTTTPAAVSPDARQIAAGTWHLATTTPDELAAHIAVTRPARLVVLLAEHAPDDLGPRILDLHALGLPVRLVPWAPPRRGASEPGREHYALPLSRRAMALKRALDLLVGLPILLAALPVMAVVALIIRLDSPGPAIFRQHRIGRDGRLFEMYKFRTMVHDPEQAEAALRAAAPDTPPPPGRPYKLPDDPRITRVGRFLRRSSLDELPQFFNVLRGDMSLVGPRPELPQIMRRYATWQLARLVVPPGMTGWWQIHGRSTHPMHLSTDDDLYYLAHYSLALDLRILARTVAAVIRGTGAY